MSLQPKIKINKPFLLKTCSKCGGSFGPESYIKTNNFIFGDGYLPICNDCIEKYLIDNKFEWRAVDKLCQCVNIPFIPAQFIKLQEMNDTKVFPIYAQVFSESEYENLDWMDYNEEFLRLKEQGQIEDELPLIKEEKIRKLKLKWGANYDEEALNYLENLYNGMLTTQNVNGVLQGDQVLKICKISYELDCRIREGTDFDKILSSYDKLVKIGEFTPKNVKNINDFDTVGELVKWFEKKGWKNQFYDNVSRDIVDETLKNIQSFNQRLYTNESGIGDEISRRIEALKTAQELEDRYDLNKEYDLENYENDGFDDLIMEKDFEAEI